MAAEYGRTVWDGRDKEANNGHEELLVFGYSCKLFRDNEKALYLDKGKHLIPWMGDSKLMVDRYDVRGALYDLTGAESGGGVDRWEGLTEEERAEEERCDHERYLALYHDELQYQTNQDEETKRLMAELGSDVYAYSQVGFNYEGQVPVGETPVQMEEPVAEQQVQIQNDEPEVNDQQEPDTRYFPEADEDTFVPPPELNVPHGMVVPETVKQNKIIVKTSKFIVTQGGQMEIVIKTKQAGNPMFSFLSFDNPLNAYYKHMVAMIKNGRYRPADEVEQVKTRRDSGGNGGQYLHPSLSAGIKPDLAPGTPIPVHKPSADCAYSKLIHKIKEKQKNTAVVERIDSPAPSSPGVSVVTSTPVATSIATSVATPIAAAVAAPVATPAVESVDLQSQDKKKIQSDSTPVGSPKVTSLVDYPSFNRTKDYDSEDDLDGKPESSISTAVSTSEYSNIKWPPPDVQMVIDKMASYIIKNGGDFEAMVRSRDDPRFSFLKKDHEYYPYYRCKIRLYSEVYGDIFKEGTEPALVQRLMGTVDGTHKMDFLGVSEQQCNHAQQKENNKVRFTKNCGKKEKRSNPKQPSTISFSIKSREQEVNLDRHSTFPVESSSTDDEDMEDEERERRRIEREERRRKRKLKEKEERERREREEKERKEKEEREKVMEKAEESTDASGDNEDVYDIFKYAQEMGNEAETAEAPSHSEKHREDERPRDDSVGSHRDVSHGVSPGPSHNSSQFSQPEKKQQERRKKAAMFLSRLKKSGGEDEVPAQPVYGPQLPPEIAAQMLNSASQSPRSSLASTRHSTPSRSRSHSTSPGPGIPMPPREEPAPPPPPPPAQSPSPPRGTEIHESVSNIIPKNNWASIPEPPVGTEIGERSKATSLKEPTVLSGTSEEGRRSESLESRRSKSRPLEVPHREKTRSRKKQRHGRSESCSPSTRRDRKKRKRSRSRSRRHKKRRSRSRSPKSHGRSSHKKKRRKHSTRHDRERGERRSKKSRRRSISSSSSGSSGPSSSSSQSSSPSDNEVQVIDSPAHSKGGSRASSVVSVGASDHLHASSSVNRIAEECISLPPTPPLPPAPPPPITARLAPIAEEKAGNGDNLLDMSASGGALSGGEEVKEEKKEEKKHQFNPQSSAAMAKIALGLRAKVHALLDKESKL
ncbi:suppressor of white apricot-like [Homarus americanus]|uniref:Suppressor of white apricot-like n=1 Tax=Homarus americanus TaxID=6706 RepID=A0A8J5N5W0_HOMAM|nr:suppressor of white apricot-like [Homarus americanus]